MEVSESLLQLRKLHRNLLDAFDKLNSLLESIQKVRDVISDLPDAHTMLKEQGYTDISMADITADTAILLLCQVFFSKSLQSLDFLENAFILSPSSRPCTFWVVLSLFL